MSHKALKNRSKHQLDGVEEKRAFVVIALTDRLSLAGKLVAFNALAHYHSELGYSWASIPLVAKESGYSPASTKSISPGFDEIEEVGAFKVVRNPPSKGNKKSSTHRCCPIMPWFRDEYERLREVGRIERDGDPFADIRSDNDNYMRQGSQADQDERQGPQPGQMRSTTRSDRADDLVRQGYKPDEENGLKGTDTSEQIQTSHGTASVAREPIDSDSGGVEARQVSRDQWNGKAAEAKLDDESGPTPPGGEWPVDIRDRFMNLYRRGGDHRKVSEALEAIRREGRTDYRDILRGAQNYGRDNKGTETRYLKAPENFLTGRLYTGYQKDNRPELRKAGAI